MKKQKIQKPQSPPTMGGNPPGFQIPPGSIPLCFIFAVREGEQERIGIIMNEQVNPMQIKFALDNANKIVEERLKQLAQQGGTPQPGEQPPQQRHPKLTELLWE